MEGIVCRLLPYAVADGPHNMAADEVLLESAAAGLPSVRFYGWSAATLSLGYFQPERLRHADDRLARLPYVRRPSGGDALVHDHELTYALALPARLAGQAAGARTAWLCRVHAVIARALGSLGVRARLYEAGRAEPFAGLLCFQHLTPGDVLVGAAKVVGSAQRRQRGAVLQHGGILLAASPHAPALPGIDALAAQALPADEVRTAVVRELGREKGWHLEAAEWDPAERRRLEELVAHKYALPGWNRKR